MKKIIIAALFAAVAIVGGYKVYSSQAEMPMLSDLTKANVEALASLPEKATCYDTITGADGIYTRYCQTCELIEGKPSFWAGKSSCSN